MKLPQATNGDHLDTVPIAHLSWVATAQSDSTKNYDGEIDEALLIDVPCWHVALGGGPHVTSEALERVEADAAYFERGHTGG